MREINHICAKSDVPVGFEITCTRETSQQLIDFLPCEGKRRIIMRYIDSWLTGLGLEYIIPKLKANGITTPKKLAQLTLRDMYEVGK